MTPREAAIAFEAVKVSMSQTKDGIKVVLVIHPNDDTQDLFNHPVGSRYQVAMVQLDDENRPIVPAEKTEGERAVVSATMLCREPEFAHWLYQNGEIIDTTEAACAHFIREYCGIGTRSQLKTNKEARKKFLDLRAEFEASK